MPMPMGFFGEEDDPDKLDIPDMSSPIPVQVEPLPETASPQPVQSQSLPPQSWDVSQGQRDDMSGRNAALGMLQASSIGLGNAANLFQQGASDPAATMALFEQYRKQVRQPEMDAQLARKQDIENQQISDISAQRQSQTAASQQKLQQQRDMYDPNSQMSKASGAMAARKWAAQADLFDQHKIGSGGAFREAAQKASGGLLSHSQIALMDSQLSRLGGDAIKIDYNEQIGKQKNAELGIKEKGVDHSSAVLDETVRHNKATEKLAGDKLEFKSTTPPQSLAKEIRTGSKNLKMIDDMLSAISKGQAPYTGTGGSTLNDAKTVFDSAASILGSDKRARTPEQTAFIGNLGEFKAIIRNPIYGAALSKFDIKDAREFLPDIGDSDNQLRVKLMRFRDMIEYNMGLQKEDYKAVTKTDYDAAAQAPGGGDDATKWALDPANANHPRLKEVKQKLGLE